MNISDVLTQVGLNEKESKVYLALLQLGQATAFNVAKKAKLKRPTVYVILEQLKEKGLTALSRSGATATFSALAPSKLYNLYQVKAGQLKEALPELNALYQLRPARPKIEIFDGAEGMRTLYYDAIEYLKRGQEVLFFSTLEHVEPYLKQELANWQKTLRQYPKARARELLNNTPLERAYAQAVADLGERYPVRFIPKSFGQTHADFFVFDDKLALVSAQPEIMAVLITHRPTVDSFRALYEMAWVAAKPLTEASS